LGRDAFLLASLGAQVTLIERADALYAALADALSRALAAGGRYAEAAARMTLIHGDSISLLPTMTPETILIDPMHPPRRGTALVKKDMRILRDIVGADTDQTALMQAALASARKRVVLKWPVYADPMPGIRAASHQIIGKNTRYDVFMTHGEKAE
jgi:16S rRNA (guanine1516-N2)-methyltransferase